MTLPINLCSNKTSRERASYSNSCVAIVWTELQQVMLMALLHQERRSLDVLFIRDSIRPIKALTALARVVVRVPNLTYSVHLIRNYRHACRTLIDPALHAVGSFQFLSWTMEHPLAHHVARKAECVEVGLFEDGTGSYHYLGKFGWRLGWRHLLTKFLIHVALWNIDGLLRIPAYHSVDGWSLFPGAFPGENIRRSSLLGAQTFRSAMIEANTNEGSIVRLGEATTLYLPSPFAEGSLMSHEDEVAIHAHAISALLSVTHAANGTIFWKSHPRADPVRERQRIAKICEQIGVQIEIISSDLNVEQIVLANADRHLVIGSVASSALYTLKALGITSHRVVCIDSLLLRKILPRSANIYRFLSNIGVEIIG